MSIGNPIKSDDNIGNIILEKLNIENIVKIRGETTPENFINKLKKCNEIIILDALEFGGYVGEVRVFDLNEVGEVSISTHSIPIDLLKKILPSSKIKVIGIQPKNIDFGEKISKELNNKIEKIVKDVTLLLKQ